MNAVPGSLRDRLEHANESVTEVESAAIDRLEDATKLFSEKKYHGAAYCGGLAAEMMLKTAIIKNQPHWATIQQIYAVFQPLKKRINVVMGANAPDNESWHGIRFWCACARVVRSDLGKSIPPWLSWAEDRIAENWWIEMRYRSAIVTRHEANDVLKTAVFLQRHRFELWS